MDDNRWFILLFIVCFFGFVGCLACIAKIIIEKKYRHRGNVASVNPTINIIESMSVSGTVNNVEIV